MAFSSLPSQWPLLSSFLLITSAFIVYLLRPLFFIVIARFRSPLRLLPSPPSPSFFLGNLGQLAQDEKNGIVNSWTEHHGHTFTYRGFINGHRLLTTDPLALSYILGHAYDFPKPDFITDALAEMGVGHDGLLTAQGDVHRRQNHAFSTSHIKSIIPIFRQKAERLRDIFVQLVDMSTTCPQPVSPSLFPVSTHPSPGEAALDHSLTTYRTSPPETRVPSATTIDVLAWLGRATLDVIGEAGFGYSFNSLPPPGTDLHRADKSENELARAFTTLFSTEQRSRVLGILALWFPFLRRFRPESRSIRDAQATMQRIGTQLINERKSSPLLDVPKCDVPISCDILSILVRANAATSPSQALTHSEMLSQISTFLLAGHETTASALTWTLYALARAPDAQTRLRAALRTCDMWDFHAMLGLPLLEHTVREALRLHAPVSSTMRVYAGATSECFVPLHYPVRVRVSRWCLQSGIHLRQGDIINIPIQAVNRATDLWGTDAQDFRPERWAALPPAVSAIPGLYAHTLTFLNGNGGATGNRSCIGYRFALAEIKVFLACLIRDLEFSTDDDVVIEKRVNIVTRPFVASSPEMGNQMPLRVRHVPQDEVIRVI
ncbi:cytochrome P450 [Russula earlei]|uniref:Cytochrome P450 n=1 Tax=Russula earlei TaxID=71964 RepID=A0ACC0TVF5_9AGAM|nr:cytochrome P450 [Russula earlei]